METPRVSVTSPPHTPFLTSVIQLLWETDIFRKSFRPIKCHSNCKNSACFFCALKSIFPNFQHHKYPGLPPNIVQRAATILQSSLRGPFDSQCLALSSLLVSLNTCLSSPLGEELFGIQIYESIACACGYSVEPRYLLWYFISFEIGRFHLQAKTLKRAETDTLLSPRHFTRLVHESIYSLHAFPCPNHTQCSRSIQPSLQLLRSPPLLLVEAEWEIGEDKVNEKLCCFLDSLATSLFLEELLPAAHRSGEKRQYQLCGIICSFEGCEVLFSYHSAYQRWVRIDPVSVKLADGTFPQLILYLKQNLYLPILLLYSDPQALSALSLPLTQSEAQTNSSDSSAGSESHLSNPWREEERDTSDWKQVNANYLQHISESIQDASVPGDESHSYGYLDFGLAAIEPHAGIINLNQDSPFCSNRDELDLFPSVLVSVHSPSQRETPNPSREDVLSSCSDLSSLSPPAAPPRNHSKRSTSQKHVPSIPTPFALLWELEVFRKSLQRVKGHVCTLKTCVFCVYQLILERFEYKDIPVVPPELLRRAMAICFEQEQGYNLGLSFDGISRTYEELLIRIHYSLTGSQNVSSCQAPHCLTHQKFSSNFTLCGECECGHRLDPSNSLELVYSISAQSLMEESRKLTQASGSCLTSTKGFETKLRLIGSLQDNQPCPNAACKAPLRIQRTLTNKPDVFTISLNWDGLPLTSQNLNDVINSIGTSICLADVFNHTQPFLKFRSFYLTAIVARNDPKYAFFFNHSTLHAWYCLDDARITTLGDKWLSVLTILHSQPYQPILLVYIDPLFSQLQTDTALTDCILSPGAEGEKIQREFLFPQTVELPAPCNRLIHGSPESMYSSDAELFQWRAGERLSTHSQSSVSPFPEEIINQNLDSENELDSSLVIHEDLGTFRIVEGADGKKNNLMDIVSSWTEISSLEEQEEATPPSLFLLWQLNVFRNCIAGLTDHNCEGDSCIICCLKMFQNSTDFCLPSEALNAILHSRNPHQPSDQEANYFFKDVLTRLHNCLSTEGPSVSPGAAGGNKCDCKSCITHQKLSVHLEISEKGTPSQSKHFFYFDLSAPELLQRIRILKSQHSRSAGSTRVMQLFTRATRSLLEQYLCTEEGTLSLLNEPEVICFSLNWEREPDRDDVSEFYELISTAIQPRDLFHHTQKYISKRIYYLLGVVTQCPTSHETWFYHNKHRSWTRYSSRTSAVTQLGPQLSLVWHSCKASTNTYAPVFLLYSNLFVCPFAEQRISPLATPPSPCVPSKHSSQYSTLTPSKPLFHEDYIVISSERNRVSPLSVQQGVDEALCYLDATLRNEEMNLTPSPAETSPHTNPIVSVKSSSLERSGTADSGTLSVISDNVQASSHSPLTSPLSDRPFSTSIFSPIKSQATPAPGPHTYTPTPLDTMDSAERISVVIFSLLQINLFRLSLLQIHDQVLENTPFLAIKQLFNVILFAPHLISSKFISVACQHLGFLSNVEGNTATDFYISFLSGLLSKYPLNPFSSYLRDSMQMQIQHKQQTFYTQIALPISANRLVILLKSSLENNHTPLAFQKRFSSLIRQALTYDNSMLTLLNSPDIIPLQLQWSPDVINSPETEFLIQNISPTLLINQLFPVVANQTISKRIFYLYGIIVSINQIQLILFYTNDIRSWVSYDGSSFQVIGYIWKDVLYFLQTNCCRPDLLLYTNPAASLIDAIPLQRGLPEIAHTKCNTSLNEIAVPILKELLDLKEASNSASNRGRTSLVHDTVKEVELQCVAGSPIKIVLSNAASIDNLNTVGNLGSWDKLDLISINSNYESSLQRRVNSRETDHSIRKSTPVLSRPGSTTSPFRIETRASYHPLFTSLVVLWSIDIFRESLLKQELRLKTPDSLPLIIRVKEIFSASDHSAALTPVLPLFQNLSSQLLKNSHLNGSGTEIFDTVLTLLKDELRKSISFQGPDPIEKSRLIQNIFSITLQESGKCRCGATYGPIEVKQNLLHLNLPFYLPHSSKACSKYGNINNVPKLAHKALRDTLVLMNKRDCKSQSCTRTYLTNSLLVTAPRVLCLAFDYEDARIENTQLLAAIPTSLRIDRLFKELGPNARANALLYLTGVMAEISKDRVVHIYYHSAIETWVSVDGMGYKEVGSWPRVIEEVEGLGAFPVSVIYTNPLDMSHHYKDPALVFPVSEVIRTMSAPSSKRETPIPSTSNAVTRSADLELKDEPKMSHYVTIEDINRNKKRKERQSKTQTEKINGLSNRSEQQHSDTSSETVGRGGKERPPLPLRLAPSKDSIVASERSGARPTFESSQFSSVSDLSTTTGKCRVPALQLTESATAKSETARPQTDGAKVKNKHKKGASATLLNKLNPKTYFKKRDKVRVPHVEQITRVYPPSGADNSSPRLSEILETPKPSRPAANTDGNYSEHLNNIFSYSPQYEQPVHSGKQPAPQRTTQPHLRPSTESPFISDRTLEAESLGLLDSIAQEFELKRTPPQPEEVPQPRPRLNLQSSSTPVPRPRELLRSPKDPFESSIAAHILLQMMNFPSYSNTVLNFSRLTIRKHQIIQALSLLFKRAASNNNTPKADIIEYLNTCMPSMLGSSDLETGHRLFHQLHWSFQPHSDAFKQHYSLQIRAKDRASGVEDVYLVNTAISDWFRAMDKPLNKNIPVTYNHKLQREALRKLFPYSSERIVNSPDQFYVAVNYDIEVDLDSASKIWRCVPTLLRLGDLAFSPERKLSNQKPFYLTGIISKSDTGALLSYSYSETRRLWLSFGPDSPNQNNLNHWEELLSYVISHSIFPLALLYTSPQARPLFSQPNEPVSTLSHATQTSLPRTSQPQYDPSSSSHSQASSLHRVRYHTLTPHPSVSSIDISRNLPVHLLSTLLINQGFTASVQSLPNDSCPAIRELRNLILTTLPAFSTRQHTITLFGEQNLGDVGGDSPQAIYQELLNKLVQRNPTLKSKLYLSVADRSGEEAISSVKVSLSGYMSQVAHIPQFSKLNPKKCKIALKPVSSIGKKQIQNAPSLLSLYVGEESSNGNSIAYLPSLLRLNYLAAINPKCYIQHVSYYLTGLILQTEESAYTSAIFLAPRNRWIMFETNSLCEGEQLTWSELCASLRSSPMSPVFCFYSNSNIMGQYSSYFPSLSCEQSLSFPTPSSTLQESYAFRTSPNSHLMDFHFPQREDSLIDFNSEDLAPTISLTNTNLPPEIFQPSLQSIIAFDRGDSPLITFPPPPSTDRSPSPTIYLLTPEINATSNLDDFKLDLPSLRETAYEPDPAPPLLISALTMLWHLPFFRHAILIAPGHTCLGHSCALCALKSVFALYYYSRSYALSSDSIRLANTHSFGSTASYRFIGELIPAVVKLVDNSLKTGRYRLLGNFVLEHDQGSLTLFPVPMSQLRDNIAALAKSKRFSREDHPLLFSKALAKTLQFRQQILAAPNVVILEFREDSVVRHPWMLGSCIKLSDLGIIVKKKESCGTTHYYLSSVYASDRAGEHFTFSYHFELGIWVGYNGHSALQFARFNSLTEHLISKRFSLISCLYFNPATPKPSPQDLPQETVRAQDAIGDSATIRRMQQAEEESSENKSSLYPALPPGIGFENLLEDYERNKQGVTKLRIPINPVPSSFLPPAQHFPIAIGAPEPPSFPPPTQPSSLFHSFPADSGTPQPHPLFTPPINLAYPPFLLPTEIPQYPPPPHTSPHSLSAKVSSPNFSFPSFPHSGKQLSTQAVTKLGDKLTETGLWANLFQSIPCIGESYEIRAFQERQKKTNFSPGRAVLERINNYQIPMEVLLEAFTQADFGEGVGLLMDPSSYSSESLSISSLSSSQTTADGSSSEEEDYNPDLSSVRAEQAENSDSAPAEEIPTTEPAGETLLGEDDELLCEERELLERKHSEEEVSLLQDYQDRVESQEARQKREIDLLNNKQLQNISDFSDMTIDSSDVPRYVPPPQIPTPTDAPTIVLPAYPASFPPTKADMFYSQARDLYRESLNISDFSVAFSLCVQAQNKLDLALIEPDVRLDPAKKQAYTQLRLVCHQQAVKLHRRSLLKTLDPGYQFKSPTKKQSNGKTKRVKFDPEIEDVREDSPPPEEPQSEPVAPYTRPILRPPPFTPSLYQSIPRPPPIGRAMMEEDKENCEPQKCEHRVDYPPSRSHQAPPIANSPGVSESPPSTPSTLSTLSDEMTSSSSSRTSNRSRKREHRRDLPPTRPFFNEDHYTILDQFIRHRRDNIPQGMAHSELSRKLLDSKINSRSITHSATSSIAASPGPEEQRPSPRDYFRICPGTEGVVPRISAEPIDGASEKCSVCRSDRFVTIKTMCPECYTRHVRSTDLMVRTGAVLTDL